MNDEEFGWTVIPLDDAYLALTFPTMEKAWTYANDFSGPCAIEKVRKNENSRNN